MIEALMKSYYAAYNSGDIASLMAILDEGVVVTSAQGTQAGREAYFATYRYMTEKFIDRMEPTSIGVDGDVANVRIDDRLIPRMDIEDFLGERVAAGKEIQLTVLGRYTIRNGKIIDIYLTLT